MQGDGMTTDGGGLGSLASHAFLLRLSERHLQLLASEVQPFHAAAGEYLAREGEPATRFYLIQAGRVALDTGTQAGDRITVQTLGPGEILGWSWLVPPYRWQFDGRALDPVAGATLDGAWLRQRCEQDQELGYHFLKHLVAVIASRLAAARRQGAGLGT
jgi:CRP/FNR family cyclic AMP-dependent transcriptional regulator